MNNYANFYPQNNFGPANNWSGGNYGTQNWAGQLSTPTRMQQQYGQWDGWSYGGLPQIRQPPPQNNSVNYVQLNWADLLGGGKAGAPVTSVGSSQFQLGNGGGEQQQQWQQPQQWKQQPVQYSFQTPAEQGDQGPSLPVAGNSGPSFTNESSSCVVDAAPTNDAPTPTPVVSGDGNAQQTQNAGGTVNAKPSKYSLCGNCSVCKYQEARKGCNRPKSYLIHNSVTPKNAPNSISKKK